MSWLLPSLPSIPGWSKPPAPAPAPVPPSPTDAPSSHDPDEDEDLDVPPQFPLPNSSQRSAAPGAPAAAAPSLALAPPSPPRVRGDESPPTDLNIAILPDPLPLGDMKLPLSTTERPTFGIKAGGGMEPPSLLGAPSALSPAAAGPKKTKTKGKGGKVALAPGCSALDWARLTRSGANMRGIPPGQFLRITKDELKLHKSADDAWSAFNGRVYNITPYLRFHPGGEEELMRVAGRDGTKLFMLTHSWVNLEHLLQECMIGMLVNN